MRVAESAKAVVQALAGVFFHVQARDTDALRASVCGRHIDPAMLGDGLVELRDLVALGQVGIEVVFAREDGALAHLAVEASAASVANSTALALSTGSAPGRPRQTGQMLVLGSEPN